MQTPTNFYNILRIKWLPKSGECRSRIEPRQLVRYEAGTALPRGEWRWESCLADDRCYEPPPAEQDEFLLATAPFAASGVEDAPRIGVYESNRGFFPVVEIRPSLITSQAHEANLWIEHHPFKKGTSDKRLLKVVWSAGKRHEVASISDGIDFANKNGIAMYPFPVVMFAPGFRQCSATYENLLQAWASAGYVVVSVDFPRTSCQVAATAYEPDLVNQPGDVSYVLSQVLALSGRPDGFLSGRLNPRQVAAAGQSDGGDTVAALGGNACCQEHRLKAVAVLSGAEWPPMPGRYFPGAAPPMLFVQGSADTINPPWTSVQLYRADRAGSRYYLDLFGADHMVPYTGDNAVERLVARVTLAFFDRYLLGGKAALTAAARAADSSGIAVLDSGGRLPSGTG